MVNLNQYIYKVKLVCKGLKGHVCARYLSDKTNLQGQIYKIIMAYIYKLFYLGSFCLLLSAH